MPWYIGLRVLAKMPPVANASDGLYSTEMHTGTPENGAPLENDPRSN
jgi:hypothetical protein